MAAGFFGAAVAAAVVEGPAAPPAMRANGARVCGAVKSRGRARAACVCPYVRAGRHVWCGGGAGRARAFKYHTTRQPRIQGRPSLSLEAWAGARWRCRSLLLQAAAAAPTPAARSRAAPLAGCCTAPSQLATAMGSSNGQLWALCAVAMSRMCWKCTCWLEERMMARVCENTKNNNNRILRNTFNTANPLLPLYSSQSWCYLCLPTCILQPRITHFTPFFTPPLLPFSSPLAARVQRLLVWCCSAAMW